MGNIFSNRRKKSSRTPSLSFHSTPKSKVDESLIDDIITDYLKKEENNNPYLPDFVERRIYKNVLSMLLNILASSVNTIEIKLLGHTIELRMRPN